MKILLVGEYSNLHNSLKNGLQQLGHQVHIVGFSDGFKKYPIDIKLERKYQNGLLKKLKNGIFTFFKIDLTSINIKKHLIKQQALLSGFDIVQFINESSFNCDPQTESEIFDFFKKNNENLFLLSCGDDYISNTYNLKKKRYSILTPYINGKIINKENSHSFKYFTPPYQKLHEHIFNNVNGIIASDIDYHLPLLNHPKYLGLIANPINTSKLKFKPLSIENKIIIFHGINTENYYKKGNDIFEEALLLISQKHKDKIEIIRTRDLPYKQYIEVYNTCHILLDQVYAFDQGFNALEAMSKGKVVFTGAEEEWLNFYNLEEDTIAINALPNAREIADKLSWLITNPKEITKISLKARSFVEEHHNYINIAKEYLASWNSKI